jgi:hypothetical protein
MHYKMTEEPLYDNENVIKKVMYVYYMHTYIVIQEDLQQTHTLGARGGGGGSSGGRRRSLKNR